MPEQEETSNGTQKICPQGRHPARSGLPAHICGGAVFAPASLAQSGKRRAAAGCLCGRVHHQPCVFPAEPLSGRIGLHQKYIESGRVLREAEFAAISSNMQDGSNVIKTHELAKDGVISQVYPIAGNEAAIGLDVLHNPARKKEANLAKNSGMYTIAGPFELVQGGTGALLFDPIYTYSKRGSARSGASPSLFYSGTTSLMKSSWTRWRMLATSIKSGKRPLYRRKDRHCGERRGFPRQCAGSCVQRPQRYMVF